MFFLTDSQPVRLSRSKPVPGTFLGNREARRGVLGWIRDPAPIGTDWKHKFAHNIMIYMPMRLLG